MRFCYGLVLVLAAFGVLPVTGAENPAPASIRKAVEKSLPLLESAAQISADKRKCFTCHHEGLPILAFTEAQKRGFKIDESLLRKLVDHTTAHLKRGKGNYLKGIGQGGKADTAGSALWALKAADASQSEFTDAVIEFLIQRDGDTPYWSAQSNRPPSEGSRFTSTYLALRGLEIYGTPEKSTEIEERRAAARVWLSETEGKTTEDHVFRLRALDLSGADESAVEKAAAPLLALQRDDGGWAQLPERESDAYATGSALAALGETGRLDPDSSTYSRGLRFLIDTQFSDGSWHVVSRSRPIQEFYESGFPHGEDQFISASGTAWATLALLRALPLESSRVPNPPSEP